jgi:hypothetical protein
LSFSIWICLELRNWNLGFGQEIDCLDAGDRNGGQGYSPEPEIDLNWKRANNKKPQAT